MSSVFDSLRGVGMKLRKLGIGDVDELARMNERELLALPGIGRAALDRIVDALASDGRALAPDPYAAYECARHSDTARDAELRSYFVCGGCRRDFTDRAFSGRAPEWTSSERIDGYCGNCNEFGAVQLTQWFLCGTCDRVMRSIGRGIAASKYVEECWASAFGDAGPTLVETDPVTLRPRGTRSSPSRIASADFVVRAPDGGPMLGLELKSGRNALPRGGIGAAMAQFQLDTTDCDDISACASSLGAPVYLVHAQIVGRAFAPTERYDGVGLWFAPPWDMLPNLESVRTRPRETRDAAYFNTRMFRPFAEFPQYIATEFEADVARMAAEGVPLLYSRA